MAYHCSSFDDDADHSIFLVGQDADGHYRVQENYGLIGGAFADRAAAIRFAHDESRHFAGSIVLVTPALIDLHRANGAAR